MYPLSIPGMDRAEDAGYIPAHTRECCGRCKYVTRRTSESGTHVRLNCSLVNIFVDKFGICDKFDRSKEKNAK